MPTVVAATSTGTTGTGTTANHTITTPACTVGDLLVASLTLNGGTGTVTEAAGWTRLFPAAITDDGFMTLIVAYRIADSADAAGGVVHTWSSATPVRSDRGCVAITAQNATPIDSDVSEVVGSGAAESTQIITNTANTLVLSFLAIDSATENATPTPPLVELWDPAGAGTNTGQVNAAAWATQATAGPTSYAWTWTNSLAHKHYVVAIAGTGGGGASVTGDAALTVTAALAATGAAGAAGTTALPITAGIAATARTGGAAGTALPIAAGIGAAARLGARAGTTALAAAATITAAGGKGYTGTATLAATATITADGVRGAPMAAAAYGIDGQAAAWTGMLEGGIAGSGGEGASIITGAAG